jgi:hypothetical protein
MPRIEYKLKDGTPVEGVTTILGVLAKPALVGWAYKQGKEGVPLYERRDKAADAGTLAHAMIQADLQGKTQPSLKGMDKDVVRKAVGCYQTFRDWSAGYGFVPTHSELSMVSEKYKFGGTMDVGMVKKVFQVLDVKTGNGIYLEAKIQISAYGMLYFENTGEKPKGYHCIRLTRDGSFEHRYWPSLKPEWEIFLACLKIRRLLKETGQKL